MTKEGSAAKVLIQADLAQNDTESSLAYAKQILQEEAEAILNLSRKLDENFEHAVQVILEMSTEGRVIVSGMGKAGFVGMKISATLASTGVPSFFLNPADAVHGDLGRYSRKDVALILSNSGETQEILRILPHIKRIGCPIISITGIASSNLARHSDIVLPIGKYPEAGPLGLAPTTSTTVMLALGDALTMAIFSRQKFTKEQFAFYHPGGSIGRSLLPISEIMRSGDEHCIVSETLSAKEVVCKIAATKSHPGAASIVNAEGILVGIFTDGGVRRCLTKGTDFLEHPIKEVMTRDPKTVDPDQLAQEALQVMSSNKINQVIVLDQDRKPIGLVHIQDLVEIRVK